MMNNVTRTEGNVKALMMGFACSIALFILTTSSVYAQGTPMGDVLCIVVGWMSGNMARGLSTLAVVMVGIGATIGKVSWGLAITVAIGISVMVNAVWLAGILVGFAGC